MNIGEEFTSMIKLNEEFPQSYRITQDELRLYLYDVGATNYRTVASTWKNCLILDNGNEQLCVLFRPNGVDLKFFTNRSGIVFVDNKRVKFNGGITCRNHYYQAEELVHKRCKKIVKKFLLGDSIHDELLYEVGISKGIRRATH